jgi:hypothetical protein
MTHTGTSPSPFVYLILIIFLVCVKEATALLVSYPSTYTQLLLQESIE